MNDTHRKIRLIYTDMLMRKTAKERLLMGFSMFDFATKFLLNSLRKQARLDCKHLTGQAPSSDLREEVFLRIYGQLPSGLSERFRELPY